MVKIAIFNKQCKDTEIIKNNKINGVKFCILLTYWINFSRSTKQIYLFCSRLIKIFVPLQSV